MEIAALLGQRLVQALITWPDVPEWRGTGVLFLLLLLAALPYGVRRGFLRFAWAQLSLKNACRLTTVSLVAPALAEEIIFRVLPLPHPQEEISFLRWWAWAAASLAAFVLYHPVKSWLLPARRETPFRDPTFLLLATLVGAACTFAYWLTGSVWPPVLVHWGYVVLWLLFWGGTERMHLTPGE